MYWFYGGAFVLIVVAVILASATRKERTDPEQTNAEVNDSFNPTNTLTANPTINIYPDREATSPASITAPAKEKEKPNIHFVEIKNVESSITQGKLFGMPIPAEKTLQATLVCFRNEALKGVTPKQPSVNAHVIYRDSQGNEMTDLNRGVWIQEREDFTKFTTGDKKCLVVLVLDEKTGALRKAWKEEYHTQNSWMAGGPLFRITDEEVPGEIETIDIQLLDKSNGSCIDEFTMRVTARREKGLPVLTCVGELTSRGSSGS